MHPNDVMDIVVVGASGESTTSTARSDYSLSLIHILGKISFADAIKNLHHRIVILAVLES